MYLKKKDVVLPLLLINNVIDSRRKDIFDLVFQKIVSLDLNKFCSLTSDGAPAMIGEGIGLVGQFRRTGIFLKNTHCFKHQQVLYSKILKNIEVQTKVTKIINKIRVGHNSLNRRKFKKISWKPWLSFSRFTSIHRGEMTQQRESFRTFYSSKRPYSTVPSIEWVQKF